MQGLSSKLDQIDEEEMNSELNIHDISLGNVKILPKYSYDIISYDLSIDKIAPCNDKYIKDFNCTWKQIEGVYYIHNNKNNKTSKEIRSEKYKYISPQLIEELYKLKIEVSELSNQFIISIRDIDHSIIIIDNVMSIAKGSIIVDGSVYIFRHILKDVTLVLRYLGSFDIKIMEPLKVSS